MIKKLFTQPHRQFRKVVVVLIYFESDKEDNTQSFWNFGLYSKEKGFLCKTGEHHLREKFIRVYSAKFRKNNAFSFCRGDNSFQVEKQVQDKTAEENCYNIPFMVF